MVSPPRPLADGQATTCSLSLDELEARLQGRLNGRIRNLQVFLQPGGVVLRGLSRTYYGKQLAQHAVMDETDLPIVANEIEVA